MSTFSAFHAPQHLFIYWLFDVQYETKQTNQTYSFMLWFWLSIQAVEMLSMKAPIYSQTWTAVPSSGFKLMDSRRHFTDCFIKTLYVPLWIEIKAVIKSVLCLWAWLWFVCIYNNSHDVWKDKKVNVRARAGVCTETFSFFIRLKSAKIQPHSKGSFEVLVGSGWFISMAHLMQS